MMPLSYQLVASAALDAIAVSSVVIFVASKPKRLELPISENSTGHERPEYETQKDPFDIVTGDDVIDGYPLDEDAFWAKVCSLIKV